MGQKTHLNMDDSSSLKKPRFVFIPIILGFFFLSIFITFKDISKLHDEYTMLGKGDSISGEIISVKHRKNISFIEFDSVKTYIHDSENHIYNPESIQRYLYKGNTFIKNANCDTIVIIQNKRKLVFVHKTIINDNAK